MVSLNRDLPRLREGGVDNPLGARALYLHQGGRDILFRIHGTNEPWSIGEQMSSEQIISDAKATLTRLMVRSGDDPVRAKIAFRELVQTSREAGHVLGDPVTRVHRVVLLLLTLLLAAGCASVPGSSEVTVLRQVGDAAEPTAPPGPARGC